MIGLYRPSFSHQLASLTSVHRYSRKIRSDSANLIVWNPTMYVCGRHFSFCIWFYLPAVGDVYTLLLIGYYLVVFGYLLVHLIAATLPVDSLYCLLRFPPVLVLWFALSVSWFSSWVGGGRFGQCYCFVWVGTLSSIFVRGRPIAENFRLWFRGLYIKKQAWWLSWRRFVTLSQPNWVERNLTTCLIHVFCTFMDMGTGIPVWQAWWEPLPLGHWTEWLTTFNSLYGSVRGFCRPW